MTRVLALVGAVFLIAAAVLARALLTDDGGDGDGDDDGERLAVACIPELADACEAIDRSMTLTIEDPADTIARIAAGEDVDAWVTFDPWPAMAPLIERRATFEVVEPVAADELVLLARAGRVDASGCADPVTWSCLVDELGDSVAVPDPGSALGTLVLGQAATDFFGGSFAANDLQEPELAGRLAAVDIADDPLADLRVGLPEPAATGVLRVDLLSLGARVDDFVESPSGAPATVAVVVAGRDADRVAGEPGFVAALADLGWRTDASSASTGLPNAGVLVALRGAVR